MKKKTIFGKKQLVMAGLVAALGAAVWLNMEYSSSSGGFNVSSNISSESKNLGDTKYVMAEGETSSTESEATVSDYFSTARKERENSRNEAIALLEEQVKSTSATDNAKEKANDSINEIAGRIEAESSIESLVKAKGFEDVLVIIGDNDVNVIVRADELLQSQTLQIQDAVTSVKDISLKKIKIVNRK